MDVSKDPVTGEKWVDILNASDVDYYWLGASTGLITSATITTTGTLIIQAAFNYIGRIVPELRILGNNGAEIDTLYGDGFPEDYDYLREAWACEVTRQTARRKRI